MASSPNDAASAPTRSPLNAIAGMAFLASFLLIGAAHAQSVSVKIDGLSDRAIHRALVSAATQVCRSDDHSPLAPVAETICIEDTYAAAQQKLAEIRRAHADYAVLERAAAPQAHR